MNQNPADLFRIVKSDVLPGLATVDRFIDAVARRKIGANVGLAGSSVNNIGIRWRNFDGADGGDTLIVKDRRPYHSRVRGLPDSAADSAEIKRVGIAGYARGGDSPAAAEGTDQPPSQSIEQACGNILRGQQSG